MKYLIIFIYCYWSMPLFAQVKDTNDIQLLESVVVTGYHEELTKHLSQNIVLLKIDSLSRFGNFNLTDLMAKTPGISMLSTGIAIAKPVIRGLYGNRVLLLISGLKFDNQQWQEEHGLGLADIGLSKVEIIKGPMSVLYGTEAVGGVINVIEEEKPPVNTSQTDFSLRVNSNTLGGNLQAGYKVNKGKNWFRIRLGAENNSDYSDGKNRRVLNSRFDGYTLKSTFGFRKGKWTSNNNYFGSFNRYGFIFNDIYSFIEPDKRWSRKLNKNPTHLVLLNILSSENKRILKGGSTFYLNIGLQSNERMENEGGGAISLNMHLLTFQYLTKWEKQLNERNRLIVSHLGSLENNTNYGSRKIVPDAWMQESNISLYLRTDFKNKLTLENGLGVGEKWIQTRFTPTVNSPEKEISPFSKFSGYYNAYSGLTYYPGKWTVKMNLATGVRIPNLAELSSNGLHEGIFTYEIGNPLLKNEQIASVNFVADYSGKWWEINITPFYNRFFNYVYLTPTTEDWYGFPVYRYLQQNAQQYGTEVILTVIPHPKWQFSTAYSGMVSKTDDGKFTPYTPAQKITPKLSYVFSKMGKIKWSAFSSADFCLAQNQIAPEEISTPKYWLLNAGVSAELVRGGRIYSLNLVGNNLLNTAYYDHLSRFKNFGLLNIRRTITFYFCIKFNGPTKPSR